MADVLETHMSYPLLTVFRSPHDNTSWVTSLGSVLDAATLIITSVDDEPDERAKLLYGTASTRWRTSSTTCGSRSGKR